MRKNLAAILKDNWKSIRLLAAASVFVGLPGCVQECDLFPDNNAPRIVSSPVKEFYTEQGYYYDVDAIDVDNDKISYFLVKAPDWLTIDTDTGVIVDVPEKDIAEEKPDLIVGASDGRLVDTQSYTLVVHSSPVPIPK